MTPCLDRGALVQQGVTTGTETRELSTLCGQVKRKGHHDSKNHIPRGHTRDSKR